MYRREWLLSQNRSIHGAKLHSGMESREGEGEGRGGEAEREEAAASANVTGLHSDVGVQ